MRKILKKIVITNDIDLTNVFSLNGKIYTFLNPVSYLIARNNKVLFNSIDGIFVDGSILIFFIRIFYFRSIKRRSFDMTSLAPVLFNYAIQNKKSIYFVGSKNQELIYALDIIRNRYPNLNIIGYRNGFFESECDRNSTFQNICNLNPNFVIIGMGAKTQEEFSNLLMKHGYNGIIFTCGGFIHQTSRSKMYYYPKIINKFNIRFIYRMYKEKYTRKRYLKTMLIFPFLFIYDRII